MTKAELSQTIKELVRLRDREDRLKKEIEARQTALKQHLTDKGVDEVRHDGYVIAWKEISAEKLDVKALRAELPDLVARYTRTTTGRRFTVSSNA
ncbi:MAG: hypothetical protein IJ124_08290 [Clostridia bacterium]|nr:hypothetical protein [Clostridia bacterium]